MAVLETAPAVIRQGRATHTTDRVREIVSWYESDNPGTKANIARLLTHGYLAGTGKLVNQSINWFQFHFSLGQTF